MINQFEHLTTERLFLRKLDEAGSAILLNDLNQEEQMKFFGLENVSTLEGHLKPFKDGMTMHGKSFTFFYLVEKSSGKSDRLGWLSHMVSETRPGRNRL